MNHNDMVELGSLAARKRWSEISVEEQMRLYELASDFGRSFRNEVGDRFWSKVKRGEDSACWPWTACLHYKGYGVFRFNGKTDKAHRVAWKLTHGEVPKGLCVCHKCDNRPCCNPAHLFLGTTGDNTRDSVRKGRFVSTKKGEGHVKHKLTNELVKQFRNLYDGGMSAYAIAKTFPIVTEATMIRVVRRETWKHL